MRKPPRQLMIRVSVGLALAVAFSLSPAVIAAQSPQLMRFDGGAHDRAGAITVDGAGNSYLAGAVDEGGGGSSLAVVKLGPDGACAGERGTTARGAAWGARPTRSRWTARGTCTPRGTSATV